MPKFLDFKNPMISTTPAGDEYLRRYFIYESPRFRIYLHKISLSDADPCMHDHPWRFMSIILRGGYREHTPHGVFDRRPGRIIYHPLIWLHRLELKKPAWTILIGGAVKREWGFMTPTGWQHSDEYIRERGGRKQRPSEPRRPRKRRHRSAPCPECDGRTLQARCQGCERTERGAFCLNRAKKFNVGNIYTDRYVRGHDYPSFQLIHEWEDQVAALTQLPICDSRTLRRWHENLVARVLFRVPGALDALRVCDALTARETKSLYFAMTPQHRNSFSVRAHVIPIIVDFWKSVDLPEFYRSYANCPMVLITSLEAFNFLKENGCPLNLYHFPLSLPDKYRTSPTAQFEKKYDVLLAGRSNPVLLEFLQRYEREHPDLEYVYQTVIDGNFCYCSNRSGVIGTFNDRESYVRLLRASRVGFYSTPGIDGGEKRTGGFNPVTPRLFELLAGACHVVARYPDNDDTRFFELNGICPSIDSYDEFAATLKTALTTPPPVERHHAYLEKHYTSARVDLLNRLVDITN